MWPTSQPTVRLDVFVAARTEPARRRPSVAEHPRVYRSTVDRTSFRTSDCCQHSECLISTIQAMRCSLCVSHWRSSRSNRCERWRPKYCLHAIPLWTVIHRIILRHDIAPLCWKCYSHPTLKDNATTLCLFYMQICRTLSKLVWFFVVLVEFRISLKPSRPVVSL